MKKILTLFIAVFTLFLAVSCASKVECNSLTATATRIDLSITFVAEFENGKIFKEEGEKAYVSLYEGENYKSTVDMTFINDECTEGEAKFTNLTPGVEYTGKLYYTLDGAKKFVKEINSTIEADGDAEKPIIINTKEDFLNMKNDLSAHYELGADIDFTEGDSTTYDKISIFTSSKIFKGHFDGKGHTVKDFGLTSNTYMALFGYTENATIKNLKIENVTVDLSSTGRGETYMGAVVGKAINTTIENVEVSNVSFKFKGYSTAKVSLGGFAGRLESSTVKNSSIEEANIEITYARLEMALGLFVGYSEANTSITNCYSKGNLSARVYFSSDEDANDYVYVGGFVGINDSQLSIKNCYTVATIKVNEDEAKTTVSKSHRLAVGGFAGGNKLGSFKAENCIAVADLDVTTEHSNKAYVAGFAGRIIHSTSKLLNVAYTAKENGIKLVCKADNVFASLTTAYCDTKKVENVVTYTDLITVPEGFTPIAVEKTSTDKTVEELINSYFTK